jgi:nicotinate dehydrogenase subunit B
MASIARRAFLQGTAGLVVAFTMPLGAQASPATLDADKVDAYLAIAPDGSATVYAGKVDLGTGAGAPRPPNNPPQHTKTTPKNKK